MIDAMGMAAGFGLAASQIGMPLRLAMIEIPEDEVIVLIQR